MPSELDEYKIPSALRIKIFKWGLGGLSATCIFLLVKLITCYGVNRQDNLNQMASWQQLYIASQHIRDSVQIATTKEVKPIEKQIIQYQKAVDTLSHKIDSAKNK